MTITQTEREWLDTLKRQTQRDVESWRLDAIEAFRIGLNHPAPSRKP